MASHYYANRAGYGMVLNFDPGLEQAIELACSRAEQFAQQLSGMAVPCYTHDVRHGMRRWSGRVSTLGDTGLWAEASTHALARTAPYY